MKRWLIFLIATLILAGIGGAAYLGYLATLPADASVVEVPPTIAVDRGTVAQSVSAPGQLVAMREQILGFEVAGRLTQLNTRAGAHVKAGELLAQLSDSVYEYSLVAPFDGVIQEVRPIVGETLSAGAPVIQLLDAKALEARLTVTEEDYPLVEVGQRAQLYFDSQPDLIITGTVTAIAPLREAGSDSPIYPVYVALDNMPDGLAPGMTVDSSILIAERPNVLRLPRALTRANREGVADVQVWTNGMTEARTIQTGLRGDQYIEIVSGVAEGEQVVSR